MSFTLPDEVEDATNIDLEGVPPRIRIFLIQRLNTKMNRFIKSQQASGQMKKERGGDRLTRCERGYSARVSDEYIELPKAPQHAPHGVPRALDVTHVRRDHKHFRTVCAGGDGGGDRVSRLCEGVRGPRDDRHGRARARVLQRGLAPDATRGARD